MLSDHELSEIKRRALEIQAIIERREGQFSAELVPDCEALWHPLAISPGNEFKAVKFLSERGFGVFLPRFTEGASLKLDGVELCGGRRLVFPGHCFVFVWDVMRHWRRIRSCPGVVKILVDGAQRPIIVNDATMDFIQALQYGLDPKPKRKRYNRGKSTENAGDERVDFVLIRTLEGNRPNETLDRVA